MTCLDWLTAPGTVRGMKATPERDDAWSDDDVAGWLERPAERGDWTADPARVSRAPRTRAGRVATRVTIVVLGLAVVTPMVVLLAGVLVGAMRSVS